jgi:hypothetical protein
MLRQMRDVLKLIWWVVSWLSLSEIKSEHSGGVIRRELAPAECAQQPERPVALAHLCSETSVCERHYNTAYKRGEHGAGVVRRRRRHDQDIPAGSNQSIVPYVHSAMAIAVRLAGHESPSREDAV